MNAFDIIRKELPRFMNEPQAEGLRGTLETLIPQTPAEVGLAMVTGPFGKAAKLGGAALAGLTASSDAEAAGVPWGAVTQIKKLISAGDVPAGYLDAIKRILRKTDETGHEFATYSGDPRQRLMTSGMPDQVVTAPAVADMMNVARTQGKSGVFAHSHPRGTGADPSLHDLQATNRLSELVVTPSARNEFTFFKPNKDVRTLYYKPNVEGRPFEDAPGLLEYLRGFKHDQIAQDWAVRKGLVDFKKQGAELQPFAEFVERTSPLQYLNMAERTGRGTTQHQSGMTFLPKTREFIPTDALISDYYEKILRGQF